MSLSILVWSYLKARPLTTVLNIFLMALGTAVITVLLLFMNQLEDKVTANAKGIDLVVGAKGSPLQLILCSIFHIDFPTGNIRLSEAEKITRHRLVKNVIPMALGDSYNGFRIVGTTKQYPELYNAALANGEWWTKDLEVTVGAVAAERNHLKTGDTFTSAHGLTSDGHDHETNQYVVAGVLQKSNTVVDDLIFTSIESIWLVHEIIEQNSKAPSTPSRLVPSREAGDSTLEITSLLVQYRNPLAVIQLPRFVNSTGNLQAAAPAFETARLFSILGAGVDVLRGFAMVLIFISGLSIFIALFNSLKERRYDLAIMRSMGAGRKKLFLSIILEGVTLTLAGSLIGLAMGHGGLFVFINLIEERAASGMDGLIFYAAELWIFVGSLLLGFLCSLLPGIEAYRTDIHSVLAGR